MILVEDVTLPNDALTVYKPGISATNLLFIINPDAELLLSKDFPWKENVGLKPSNSFPFLSINNPFNVTTSPARTELLLALILIECTGFSKTLISFETFTPSCSKVIFDFPLPSALSKLFASTLTTDGLDELIFTATSSLEFPFSVSIE